MTVRDIAQAAGVSPMTVSRVINEAPAVSEATAARVRQAIDELGYVPPPLEKRRRRPSRKRQGITTENVAFLLPDPDARALRTPISMALVHGIETTLHGQRLDLIVTRFRGMNELPNCIERRKVDGIIVRGGDMPDRLLRILKRFPCVWIFQPRDQHIGTDLVMPDNSAVGRLAAEELVRQGCRRLGYVADALESPAFASRNRAFVETARQAGAEPVACDPADLVAAAGACDGLFLPTSIAGNTEGVCGALAEAGREPGRDFPLVAVDEAHFLEHCQWPVTVIDLDMDHVGQAAAELLLWRMRHPDAPRRQILIQPRLLNHE